MEDANELWARSIVLYDGFTDNAPKTPPFEGEDLVAFLTSFEEPTCTLATCAGRDCPAKRRATSWSPVAYAPGATRGNAGVLAVHYAVFDLDHLKAGDLERVLAELAEFEYVVHSTHSHAPGDECYRLVFPVSRPVTPTEWPIVHDALVRALGLPADDLPDLARLYAAPTARGGVEPFAAHRRGAPIDVDDALRVPRNTTSPATLPATSDAPTEVVDLATLRRLLADARRSKASGNEKEKEQAALIGLLLDGKAIARPGERDKRLLRACGLLAFHLPAETPWETVVELLRPSLIATDLEPEGLTHWIDEARDMYARASKNRAAQDAARADEAEKWQALKDLVASKSIAAAAKTITASGENVDGWEVLLVKTRDGAPKACELNAQLLLSCAPELRGTIRFNTVVKAVEVKGGPLGGVDAAALPVAAAAWLQLHYGFQGGSALVGAALAQVARENKYDPLAEWLRGLEWDGESRLEGFLERYLGVVAEGPSARYVRAVSRCWLVGLVARALRPGCKLDTVLILEGAQGAGKSSALEALAGSEYFLDTALELGDKDTMQAIASSWLVELGELASFRKAEVGRIRQFITSKVDKFRAPYAAVMESNPRRCVFVGTTNDAGYLTDRAGNRRYWPVRIGKIDLEAIKRDRTLLLAEAVDAFKNGARWHLVDSEVALAAVEAEDRAAESTVEEAIRRWWGALAPAKRPKSVSLLAVAEALGISAERVSHGVRTDIGVALARLGFARRRKASGGYYYDAPSLSEESLSLN